VRRWDEYLKNRRQSKINLSPKLSANEFRSIYFLAAPFENNRYKSTECGWGGGRGPCTVDQYLDTLYRYKKPTQVLPIKRKQPAWGKGGQKGTQLPQMSFVNYTVKVAVLKSI
jgi:hypothetical protein